MVRSTATPCVSLQAPGVHGLSYLALTTFGNLHHAAAVAFLGIGRQNIQQIAATLRGGGDQRAIGDRIQMAVHQAHHLGFVALDQCRDDRAMLVDRAFRRMRAAVERQRQAAAIGDLADVTHQDRAVRHLGEQDVEFRRQPDRHRVRAVAGAVLGVDMGGELGDLALGQLAGELTHHQPFKLDPDIKGIAGFLPAWRRHDGDPVAAKLDETFRGELSQRMPRNGAADAEPLAKRILRQFRAGLQRLFDDGAAQRAADHADLVG